MSVDARRIDAEMIGEVTVARLVDRKVLDESNIQILGNNLFALVEKGRRKLIVDFSNVEYLSNAALGKLITLDKKMKSAKGKLRFCSIRPDVLEVFTITRLDKLFEIKPNLPQALEGM
jgi:anti-sigma B factor antagonist